MSAVHLLDCEAGLPAAAVHPLKSVDGVPAWPVAACASPRAAADEYETHRTEGLVPVELGPAVPAACNRTPASCTRDGALSFLQLQPGQLACPGVPIHVGII